MKILLIDDNPFDRTLIARELRREFPEVSVKEVNRPSFMEEVLESADYDAVITDYQLQWTTGIEVLKAIKKIDPELPVIMFTATGNEAIAVEAMRAGLDDYVIKSAKHFVRLPVSIRHAVEKRRLRQAERQAAATIARLHTHRELILDSVADGIIGIDRHGRHTFANPAALEMLGYELEELLDRDSHSLWHYCYQDGSSYPVADCPMHGSIRISKNFSGRDYFWRKNGSGFIAEFTSAPIFENDECTGAVIAFRDVTEREKNYEQLRKYEKIFAASQEHMAFVDSDYICQAVNDACLVTHRKKREETVGHTVAELFGDKVFVEKIKTKMDDCLAGDPVRFQEWFDFPDGIRRYMDTAYYPYRMADETVAGLVVNSRDITELKQQTDALQQAEQEWAHTFDSISDFVSVHDRDFRFVKVNKSLADFLGKKAEDLIGRHCYEILHGLEHCWPNCPHKDSLASGKAVSREVIDEEIGCPLLVTASPIYDTEGNVTATVHIARDLTDTKKAEEERQLLQDQLLQAQKMECVGQLAGGVAHDFNNYLCSILGYSDLILHGPEYDRDNILVMVRAINEAGERSAGLVKQLLAFSRKQIMEMNPVAIDTLINNLIKLLQRLVPENINLEFLLNTGDHYIMADSTQIEQVLMNLVVNARDAISDSGKITVETAVETIDEHQGEKLDGLPAGSYVRLTVRDTGIGIPPEIRDRIFEPFFTTKDKGKGTGLGLATVFGIITQHDGRIVCRSSEKDGTVFDIFLPVATAIQSQDADEIDIGLTRGAETILVVEDDSLTLAMLQDALSMMGYTVLPATNGEEALELYNAHAEQIALLLADVVLPGLNSPELAEMIREHSPDIRVLFISGYSDERISHYGILKPGINFLGKPIVLSKLSAKIGNILDGRK